MPKVSEQYRSDRRAAITEAASRCFVRKGVHQTSMADIITESGLSAGAIYNHFKSKEEIIVSVAATLIRGRLLRVIQERQDAGEALTPAGMVDLALHTIRRATVADGYPLSMLIMQFWSEATVNPTMLALMQDEMLSIKQAVLSPLRQWATAEHGLSRQRARRWAEQNAQLMISMIIGFVVQRNLMADFDETSYTKHAVALAEQLSPDRS